MRTGSATIKKKLILRMKTKARGSDLPQVTDRVTETREIPGSYPNSGLLPSAFSTHATLTRENGTAGDQRGYVHREADMAETYPQNHPSLFHPSQLNASVSPGKEGIQGNYGSTFKRSTSSQQSRGLKRWVPSSASYSGSAIE